jgi:hypothetical protein
MYAVGGFGDDGKARPLEVTVMDIKKREWVDVDNDPNGIDNRAGHSAVTVEDEIFVLGGEIVGFNGDITGELISSRLTTDGLTWEEIDVEFPEPTDGAPEGGVDEVPPRSWHSAVALPNLENGPKRMLVFGGQDASQKPLGDAWLVNMAPGAFSWASPQIAGEPPAARAYHTCTYVGGSQGFVAIYGGSNSGGRLEDVFLLNTVPSGGGSEVAFTWFQLPITGPSPGPICWHSALSQLLPTPPGMSARAAEMASADGGPAAAESEVLEDESQPVAFAAGAGGGAAEQVGWAEAEGSDGKSTFLVVFGGHSDQDGVQVLRRLMLRTGMWEDVETVSQVMDQVDEHLRIESPATRYGHAAALSEIDECMVAFGGMLEGGQKTGGVCYLDVNSPFRLPEIPDGMPLGWGKHLYDDESVYEGCWKEGKRSGEGGQTYGPTGDRYDGTWAEDQRQGEGTHIYQCGTGRVCAVYEGEWAEDMCNGRGVCRYEEGPMTGHSDGPDRTAVGDGLLKGEGSCEVEYDGEWRNNARHGAGTQSYTNGDVYEGEWQGGMKHGRGTMSYGDGGKYQGWWADGKRQGAGWWRTARGDLYEGSFLFGEIDGQGVANMASGCVYTGNFKMGLRNGLGLCIYDNKNVYQGKWRADMRCGAGTQIFAAGHRYDGQWYDDVRSGQGVQVYNGEEGTYDGNWANDMRSGKGTCTWANGTVYRGDWAFDVRSGQGECEYYNKESPPQPTDVYQGSWGDNQRNGFGTCDFRNGDNYEGMWADDVQAGQGTTTSPAGDSQRGLYSGGKANGHGTLDKLQGREPKHYEGNFKNGLCHGDGTADFGDGMQERYEGEYAFGVRAGKGSQTYVNGNDYDGEWAADKRNGTGVWTVRENGQTESYEGEWKDDMRHVRDENWDDLNSSVRFSQSKMEQSSRWGNPNTNDDDGEGDYGDDDNDQF